MNTNIYNILKNMDDECKLFALLIKYTYLFGTDLWELGYVCVCTLCLGFKIKQVADIILHFTRWSFDYVP